MSDEQETTTVEETPVEETPCEEEPEEEVEYECPCEFDEKDELCKMFVGGLSKETTEEEFKALFEPYGEIKECDNLDDCLLARPHKYKERELDVKRAVPKDRNDLSGHFRVKKLHLGNIPQAFDTKALSRYLRSRHPKKYGTIEEIDILKSKEDPEKNRGFGFITVSSEDFADRISIAEKTFTLDGTELKINKAKPKGADAGGPRGGFRGKGPAFRGGRGGGGWNNNWGGYGGYGGYDGYAYGAGGYGGYGAGYGGYGGDGYGYPQGGYGYGGFGGPPQRGGRGGKRYNPY